MRWSDRGFLISVRPFGENDALAGFLTASHGKTAGLVKGGQSRRQRPFLQIGNSFSLVWKARLESQLGFFSLEPIEQKTARILGDFEAASMLQSSCAILSDALAEGDSNWRIFENTGLLFDNLTLANYVSWERELLSELGFKMSLDKCNATGSHENLVYISPKTGHAVSAAAGAPYRERLLEMPRVWSADPPPSPTRADFQEALRVLGFFLDARVYSHLKRNLPFARRSLAAEE